MKGTLHSRAKQSLAILCEIILVDVKHDQLDIAYLMLQKLGILLGNHTETQHFEPVWELTYEIIDKVSTIFIQTTITDNSPNLLLEQECLRFGKSVRFFANLVAGQKGERITGITLFNRLTPPIFLTLFPLIHYRSQKDIQVHGNSHNQCSSSLFFITDIY